MLPSHVVAPMGEVFAKEIRVDGLGLPLMEVRKRQQMTIGPNDFGPATTILDWAHQVGTILPGQRRQRKTPSRRQKRSRQASTEEGLPRQRAETSEGMVRGERCPLFLLLVNHQEAVSPRPFQTPPPEIGICVHHKTSLGLSAVETKTRGGCRWFGSADVVVSNL